MAKCDSFHTQLTTIMDIMTKTALAQICRLFEEDSANLRKEMSRVMTENKLLHDQLRCLECELTIVQGKKGPHKRPKAYHTVGIQTGETHRGGEKDNTGIIRAPSINGIFGKEWCINLWNDGETQGCNPADAEPRSDFDEEYKEDDQDQIELLTIKEEESEVDISDRNQQMLEAFIKEGGTWVSDRSETASTDRHYTDVVRRGGHSSISADSSEVDFENLLESSAISREQHTEFISLDGTTGDYTIMPTASVSPDYDPHCVPIEYEYEGIEGERELVAFEGLSEIPSQPVFIKTEAATKTESAETFGYFDRFDLRQSPKRRNKFHCKLCGKTYVKYNTLKTHMRAHKREKVHRCRVCKSVFPQKNLLRTHKCSVVQNNVQNNVQKTVQNNKAKAKNSCEYCGRAFTTNANLRVHYAVHTGERPHKCDICGKTFTQKGNMNIHRRIHTGEKPFSCPVCHKSFSQKINLRHHVVTHGKKYAIKKEPKKKTKTDD
ncbi:hypothetical protein ACEWY4_003352 [Coilia grayii]|uniref:C2H2-type domain-containing protein n=1 Tax=Coilia grayii TaxID=363190 RepID=A0ABD1KQZ3_9TELE